MELCKAVQLITRAIDTGTLANGYLVCGDLQREAREFADAVLHKLFPDEPGQVECHEHPDLVWLEAEGKSRTIHTKSVREGLVEPMYKTAYSGGWKVGVIVGADRMEQNAANSFLKLLEEPPPKTLFLLMTDAPDAVMTTIVSRCQRIDLPKPKGIFEGERYASVAAVMTAKVTDAWGRAKAGARLAEILGEAKDDADETEVPLVRKAFFRTVLGFVRGWMAEDKIPRHLAFHNVAVVEEAFRQSERYISDDTVVGLMTDRISWPA